MSDKRKQSSGTVIKRVHLDEDQYTRALKVTAAREFAAEFLGQAMAKAFAEVVSEEALLLDQLRHVADIESAEDTSLTIEWITRDLVVRQREEDE